MFTLLDIIFPIGIGLGVAALCIVAMVRSRVLAAKVISAIVGVVFLLSIPTWYIMRYNYIAPDYVTSTGLRIKQGDVNKCLPTDVEKWADWVVSFWKKHYPDDLIDSSIKGKLCICIDKEKLSVMGRFVRGYSYSDKMVIGWNGDLKYTESLFKHELSHIILLGCGEVYDNTAQHAIFKDKGLGH